MSVRNQNVMLNAYYDFNTGTKFTPYVGGGIGLAHLKASSKFAGTDGADYAAGKIKESSNNFAWNLAAGVGYEVNSNITVDLGYRYVDNGDLTKTMYTGDRFKVESEAHEILLGARFSFRLSQIKRKAGVELRPFVCQSGTVQTAEAAFSSFSAAM